MGDRHWHSEVVSTFWEASELNQRKEKPQLFGGWIRKHWLPKVLSHLGETSVLTNGVVDCVQNSVLDIRWWALLYMSLNADDRAHPLVSCQRDMLGGLVSKKTYWPYFGTSGERLTSLHLETVGVLPTWEEKLKLLSMPKLIFPGIKTNHTVHPFRAN